MTQSSQLNSSPQQTPDELSRVIILLLKGVIYEETDSKNWLNLLRYQLAIRDYLAVLNLELFIDESEGYCFVKQKNLSNEDEADDSEKLLPKLFSRRRLSYSVSLLLVLLRKKLAEFDSSAQETRLIISRDEIVELIQVFLSDNSDQAKLTDQVQTIINKVIELGFLQRLKSQQVLNSHMYEVKRILKAFVDGQCLAGFNQKLLNYSLYSEHLRTTQEA